MYRVLPALAFCAALSGCATAASPGEAPNSSAAPSWTPAEQDPEAGDYWFRLANNHAEAGRLEEAEGAYRQALKRGKGVKALHNLGLVQVWLGVKALREAGTQLPPDDPTHLETRRYLNVLLQGL